MAHGVSSNPTGGHSSTEHDRAHPPQPEESHPTTEHPSDSSPPPADSGQSAGGTDTGGTDTGGTDTGASHASVIDLGIDTSDGGPMIAADVGSDSTGSLVHADVDGSGLTDGIGGAGDTVGGLLDTGGDTLGGLNLGDTVGNVLGDGLSGQLLNANVDASGDGPLLTADAVSNGDSSLIHADVDGSGLTDGLSASDVGDTVNGLLGSVNGTDVGDTVDGLLGGVNGNLLNADVSGPVDANANVGNGTGDPLINADVNAGDAGTGLVTGDLGNLLNTADVGNVLDTGNIGLLQRGALDQPLASVDTNGSADGSLVVGGDQADAANALITVDADTSHTGDLGLGNVDLPVDVGGIGDLGGLLDTHTG
jgi:hypothetical protein